MATILVVDDIAANREFLVTLLGYSNHRLLEAPNGAVALKLTKEEHPDLIITDIFMPVMDGYELTKRIREDKEIAETPIIFYTATYRAVDAAIMALKVGIKHVLSKPSEPEVILEMVNKVLNEKAAPGAIAAEPDTNAASQNGPAEKKAPQSASLPSEFSSDIAAIENEVNSLMRGTEELYKGNERLVNISKHLSARLNKLLTMNNRFLAFFELKNYLYTLSDINQLFESFSKGARRIEGVKYCSIGVFQNGRSLFTRYVAGTHGPVVASKMEMPEADNSFILQLLTKRTAMRINNIQEETFVELPQTHMIEQSILGVPLQTRDTLFGFLYFADKLDHSVFNDLDMEIALALGAEISLLYDNIKLHEQVKKSNVPLPA